MDNSDYLLSLFDRLKRSTEIQKFSVPVNSKYNSFPYGFVFLNVGEQSFNIDNTVTIQGCYHITALSFAIFVCSCSIYPRNIRSSSSYYSIHKDSFQIIWD